MFGKMWVLKVHKKYWPKRADLKATGGGVGTMGAGAGRARGMGASGAGAGTTLPRETTAGAETAAAAGPR